MTEEQAKLRDEANSAIRVLSKCGAIETLRGGKDFITAVGLNYLATTRGINVVVAIDRDLCDPSAGRYVVVATGTDRDGNVTIDVGDASPENVPKAIRGSELRMASTRARNRVIRNMVADLLPFIRKNIQWTTHEELPSDESVVENETASTPHERIAKY